MADLEAAGYQFLPGGEGYRRPDGLPVLIWRNLPLWVQVAKAHRTYAATCR
jgi:hypothetical protein